MKFVDLKEIKEQGVSHDSQILKKVVLHNKLIPLLTNFSTSVIKSSQKTTEHYHDDMYEIFFVLSGRGRFTVDDRNWEFYEGCCMAVFPKETHSLENTGDSDLIIIYFGIEECQKERLL